MPPAIYLLAADKLGVVPTACVFIDDIAINLRPAKKWARQLSITSSR